MIIRKFDIFGMDEASYFSRAHINFVCLSQTGCDVESLYITLLLKAKHSSGKGGRELKDLHICLIYPQLHLV